MKHCLTTLCPNLHRKVMTLVFKDLREGEIKPERRLGAGMHRDTKTRSPSLSTVDCDDEDLFAAGLVYWIDVGALEKNFVLNSDRVELARTHSDERHSRSAFLLSKRLKTAAVASGLP
jgi:hypothetical protein